jgi:hypothetical protein
MRVTTSSRSHAVAVSIAVAIALSVLLLVVTTLGGSAAPNDADDANTPTADAVTQDSGYVNPWAAGSAAAERYLAELGRKCTLQTEISAWQVAGWDGLRVVSLPGRDLAVWQRTKSSM